MTEKPNIVIIITDSQGWNLLGETGSGFIQTPNIDQLAREGTRFDRAYNTCPVCTPARAGLFTGQYPHNAGAWGNDIPLGQTVKTIGEYFQKEGYRTGYIGKWHLDGFDYFGTGIPAPGYDPGYWYDGRNYLDDLSEEERIRWRKGFKTPQSIHEAGITRNHTWGGRVTDRAVDFIGENDYRPFLLIVSYDEPHGPSLCPPPFCDMYRDFHYPLPANYVDTLETKPIHHNVWAEHHRWQENQTHITAPLYFGCASFVDDEIGKVVNAINDKDSNNTIVVFTSDHGHYLGAHKLAGKGPALYEEVVRVPMIIRAPGITPAASVCSALVSHIDLMPTLMDMAGLVRPPVLEGTNIKRTLIHPHERCRDEVFVEFNRFAICSNGWFGFIPIRSIVTDQYKLVINLHQTDELYDLKNDPGEMVNLIENPETVQVRDELHRRLLTWMEESRDPFRCAEWEYRPWRGVHKDIWTNAQRLHRKTDGFLPVCNNYDTGMPPW